MRKNMIGRVRPNRKHQAFTEISMNLVQDSVQCVSGRNLQNPQGNQGWLFVAICVSIYTYLK